MLRSCPILACAGFLSLTSGCATIGTNVKGDFTCRAPRGDCAPAHVIDERATGSLAPAALSEAAGPVSARARAEVSAADPARTGERTLRVVFPAHVDAAGILHEDAVAWVVVETPRWRGELTGRESAARGAPVMRQLCRQLKTAQARPATPEETMDTPSADNAQIPFAAVADERPDPADPVGSPAASTDPALSAAPPLVLPSTAREAVAGASAPGVPGFDMPPPPHDRAPGSEASPASPVFPSAAAIAAARAASHAPASTPKTQEPQ
ncbi:TraV family lipoprotein [Novosphingobium piscinae]|uniref:TraV family lipoprotein n=1 Tax=Novosphingobium piscinae TaxID=1507448 RepID=A0A7X1FXQ5_9SPHN|nr:TraV family lipoprotein [Novosphingobium piscinae]MBC2668237.1 TraV family lipoprotein [Novosphingobium piscinae]